MVGYSVSRLSSGWLQIFESLLRVYKKLRALGFVYFKGKLIIIDLEEEKIWLRFILVSKSLLGIVLHHGESNEEDQSQWIY